MIIYEEVDSLAYVLNKNRFNGNTGVFRLAPKNIVEALRCYIEYNTNITDNVVIKSLSFNPENNEFVLILELE